MEVNSKKRITIWVVDDLPTDRMSISRKLSAVAKSRLPHGVDVHCFPSEEEIDNQSASSDVDASLPTLQAAEADLVRGYRPDIILCDLYGHVAEKHDAVNQIIENIKIVKRFKDQQIAVVIYTWVFNYYTKYRLEPDFDIAKRLYRTLQNEKLWDLVVHKDDKQCTDCDFKVDEIWARLYPQIAEKLAAMGVVG